MKLLLKSNTNLVHLAGLVELKFQLEFLQTCGLVGRLDTGVPRNLGIVVLPVSRIEADESKNDSKKAHKFSAVGLWPGVCVLGRLGSSPSNGLVYDLCSRQLKQFAHLVCCVTTPIERQPLQFSKFGLAYCNESRALSSQARISFDKLIGAVSPNEKPLHMTYTS